MARRIIPCGEKSPYMRALVPIVKALRQLKVDLDIRPLNPRDFQPIIYIWMRVEECLYVGQSRTGIGRILGDHHVIKEILPEDDIYIIDVPHLEDWQRRNLELRLIRVLAPRFNRSGRLLGPQADA